MASLAFPCFPSRGLKWRWSSWCHCHDIFDGGGEGGLGGNKEEDNGGGDEDDDDCDGDEVDGAHIKSALLVLELVFIIVQRIVETSSTRCVVLLS